MELSHINFNSWVEIDEEIGEEIDEETGQEIVEETAKNTAKTQ
jgi:hypothetical protein